MSINVNSILISVNFISTVVLFILFPNEYFNPIRLNTGPLRCTGFILFKEIQRFLPFEAILLETHVPQCRLNSLQFLSSDFKRELWHEMTAFFSCIALTHNWFLTLAWVLISFACQERRPRSAKGCWLQPTLQTLSSSA